MKQQVKTIQKIKILLAFIIIFSVMIILLTFYINEFITNRKERYHYIGENQTFVIQDKFNLAVSKLDIIESIININENTDFFDTTAKQIFEDAKTETGLNIISISIAPNGVIDKVYPDNQKDSLKGFNFLDETLPGNEEAISAYNSRKLIVTDFFNLKQGVKGIAIRKPIILHNEVWGLISIAIDEKDFDKQLGLDNLGDMGIYYRLSDNNNKVIATNSTKDHDYVDIKMSYKNLKWTLSIAPIEGWIDPVKVVLIIIGFFLISLLATILLAISVSLRSANKNLYDLANIDPLSRCYTRNYVISQIVNIKTGDFKIPHQQYSIVYIDIDYFKNINDLYGHYIGDEIIEVVSTIFREALTDNDFVARYGGDEFVIFFKNIEKEELIAKVENIIKQVNDLRIDRQKDLRITLSIGIAYCKDEESDRYIDLLESADKKLYESKEKGKNQYTI